MISETVKVNLVADAEARPVAVLVQKASQFESKVYIQAGDKKINAKSIMGMMRAHENIDIRPIFLRKTLYVPDVALCLLGTHSHTRNVAAVVKLHRMTGKAETLHTRLDSVFDVFAHLTRGMAAKRGVSVVIVDQEYPFFLFFCL